MQTKDITIDEFIEIVAPKLKHRVITTPSEISGRELLLTGVKDVQGKQIEPDKVYSMPVPTVVHQPHERKLRIAYLRAGRNGIRNYLSKWLEQSVLDQVMSVCPEQKFKRKAA